eukprot:4859328-Amphidinium_carterae.1
MVTITPNSKGYGPKGTAFDCLELLEKYSRLRTSAMECPNFCLCYRGPDYDAMLSDFNSTESTFHSIIWKEISSSNGKTPPQKHVLTSE